MKYSLHIEYIKNIDDIKREDEFAEYVSNLVMTNIEMLVGIYRWEKINQFNKKIRLCQTTEGILI